MTTAIGAQPPPAPAARPRRPIGPIATRTFIAAIVAIGFVWGVTGLDISWAKLSDAPGKTWTAVRQMWPPDFATEFDRGVLGKVADSVYIAWIGTMIGAFFSLPLAFLAANNISPSYIRLPVRQLFNAIRAVPELVVAGVLLGVVPLGEWAGALAIGLHSIGTLGKLSSEEIEAADRGPIEAVGACGGRWVSKVRWGVLPQVMPIITSYWLFRFEINVRASAVLGMIGAGGVGAELVSQLRFRNYPEVGAVMLLTIATVIAIDTISGALRRRIIAGGARRVDDDAPNTEVLSDLTGRWG